MTEEEAFFLLHSGLPREGPGSSDDVARAVVAAGGPAGVKRIADMGCGPGADIPMLLASCPEATLTAVDALRPFIEVVRARHADDPRVTAVAGDMARVAGPFDLIWSAGALYFLGLDAGLATMRAKLAPAGVLVFSHPCFFVDEPSAAARDFWQGEDALVAGRDALLGAVETAGFEVLAEWPVSDAGWTLYYTPLAARAARLRDGAGTDLSKVLDAGDAEYDAWRKAKGETGYLMVVARRDER